MDDVPDMEIEPPVQEENKTNFSFGYTYELANGEVKRKNENKSNKKPNVATIWHGQKLVSDEPIRGHNWLPEMDKTIGNIGIVKQVIEPQLIWKLLHL